MNKYKKIIIGLLFVFVALVTLVALKVRSENKTNIKTFEMLSKMSTDPKPSGKIVYVDGKCNDGNGSIDRPFRLIEDAINVVTAGDVIYIREGIYKETLYLDKSGSEDDGYIFIKGYPGEQVILTHNEGEDGAVIELDNCHHICISDLIIGDLKAKSVCGIYAGAGVHNVYISNNEFRNIVTTDPDGDGESNAIICLGEGSAERDAISNIYIKNNLVHHNINGWSENISVAGNCKNVYVVGNTIHDCTNIGIDFYGNANYCTNPELDHPRYCLASGNVVYNCVCDYAECAGIYVDGSSYVEISNNTVYKNAYGIEVGSEENPKSKAGLVQNIYVHDNDIHDNLVCGIIIGGYSSDNQTGTVTKVEICRNNIANNGIGEDVYNGEICFAKCNDVTIADNYIQRDIKDAPFIGTWMDGKLAGNIRFKNNTYCTSMEDFEIQFEIPYGDSIKKIIGIDEMNSLDITDGEKYKKNLN